MKIEAWFIDAQGHLLGLTPEGKFLISSRIVSKGRQHVTTKSGSVYKLGNHSEVHNEFASINYLHAIPYEPQEDPKGEF